MQSSKGIKAPGWWLMVKRGAPAQRAHRQGRLGRQAKPTRSVWWQEVRMTNAQKLELARKFLSVLSAPDEGVVKSVAVDDVLWTFPGTR
jgi:hypothetical protein